MTYLGNRYTTILPLKQSKFIMSRKLLCDTKNKPRATASRLGAAVFNRVSSVVFCTLGVWSLNATYFLYCFASEKVRKTNLSIEQRNFHKTIVLLVWLACIFASTDQISKWPSTCGAMWGSTLNYPRDVYKHEQRIRKLLTTEWLWNAGISLNNLYCNIYYLIYFWLFISLWRLWFQLGHCNLNPQKKFSPKVFH